VLDYEHGQPIWLRATRKGNDVTVGYSTDGKKWENERTYAVKGKVLVGFVAYGCLGEDFTATFDEYELKVAEK
jgi:regulation of enolase protein 1 (concanavalin A-like superfamily)